MAALRRRPSPMLPTAAATGITAIAGCGDSYFVIQALNRLGATHTMETFLHTSITSW